METSNILLFTLITLGVLLFLMLIRSRYITCPPGKMMVVFGNVGDSSGYGHEIIFGRGKFIIPILQKYTFIDLSIFILEFNEKLYSKEEVIIKTKMKISYAVSNKPDVSQKAGLYLFGATREEIQSLCENIIHDQVRKLFKSKDIVDIVVLRRNNKLVEEFHKNLNSELNKIGVEILSISRILINDIEEQIIILEKEYQEVEANSLLKLEEMKEAEFELKEVNNAINENVQKRNELLSHKLKLLVKIRKE